MKLYTIETGHFKLDGGAMFGVVPKSMWHKLNPADENNMCSWAMRSLLIEEGNRLILVDTGIGNKQDEKFLSRFHLHGAHSLEKSLAKHNFHKDDITDVILTHLHFDHVGGAVIRHGEKLVPNFKNATYWSNTSHWEWAIHPNEREAASFLKENILPIQESGQLKFISDEQFSENITIKFVNGHTEAMMLPLINYNNQKILYNADLFPSVYHLPLPYIMAYDMFPLKTLEERKIILREAIDNQYLFFFEHDPINECCSLIETDKGVRAHEIMKLDF